MSDQSQDPNTRPDEPPAPPPEPDPPASALPESSLTPGSPPEWSQGQPETGPYGGDSTPEYTPPPAPEPPAYQPPPPAPPLPPEAPAHQPPPVAPTPAPGAFTSGDPLAPTAGVPAGYTSPPPPGAGGVPPAFPAGRPAPGTYRLAGWWQRAGAQVIDGLIIGAVALILMIPLGIGFAASVSGEDTSDSGALAAVAGFLVTLLVFAVVALAYAPVMMARTNGKTLGRMAMGTRVIRANGQPITLGFAALREVVVKSLLVGVVSSFTFGIGYLLDILWPLWDDENRALHDFVTDTRTILD